MEMAPKDVGLDAEFQGKTKAADSVVVGGLAALEAQVHLVLYLWHPGEFPELLNFVRHYRVNIFSEKYSSSLWKRNMAVFHPVFQ